MKTLNQHIALFNRIAKTYSLFFNKQINGYFQTLRLANLDQLPLETTFLDIGSGTGALASVLFSLGYQVVGIDGSSNMVDVAKAKTNNPNIDFIVGSALSLPFEDHSFDVCIASYVAHGLKPEQRHNMLLEMKRVSKSKVILIEFSSKRNWFITFIESLEQSDYKNFIYTIAVELNDIFKDVKQISTGPYQDVWICE